MYVVFQESRSEREDGAREMEEQVVGYTYMQVPLLLTKAEKKKKKKKKKKGGGGGGVLCVYRVHTPFPAMRCCIDYNYYGGSGGIECAGLGEQQQ